MFCKREILGKKNGHPDCIGMPALIPPAEKESL
jgi:hypothetical protein